MSHGSVRLLCFSHSLIKFRSFLWGFWHPSCKPVHNRRVKQCTVKTGTVPHKPAHTQACMLEWRFTTVHCAHMRHGDPAPATPVRLWGYLGINALIETRAGQFCKCWDVKKATFYCPESLQHKAAFHRSSIWKWLSRNRRGLIVSDLFEPSGQIPSLFTQSGRAESWPSVDLSFHSMQVLWQLFRPGVSHLFL